MLGDGVSALNRTCVKAQTYTRTRTHFNAMKFRPRLLSLLKAYGAVLQRQVGLGRAPRADHVIVYCMCGFVCG